MKRLLCIWALGSWACSAGAPAGSAAETNAVLTVECRGVVWSNAVVHRVEPDGLTVFSEVRGAKLLFRDLPAEVRARFGYDEAAERAFLSAKERGAEARRRAAELREAGRVHVARMTAITNRVVDKAVFLNGRVVQRLAEGFLVSSREYGAPARTSVLNGFCFVEKTIANKHWIDEDQVQGWAYPLTLYSYTTVQGVEKTVRRVTMSLGTAIENELDLVRLEQLKK